MTKQAGEYKPQPYMADEEVRNIERVKRMFTPKADRTCKGCGNPESLNCIPDCAYAAQHDWKYQ